MTEVAAEPADPADRPDEAPPPGQYRGPALLLPAAPGTEAAHARATEDNGGALLVQSYGRSLIPAYSGGPPLYNFVLYGWAWLSTLYARTLLMCLCRGTSPFTKANGFSLTMCTD